MSDHATERCTSKWCAECRDADIAALHAEVCQLRDEVTAAYHAGYRSNEELPDVLGMSWDRYERWAETGA
jgi:hypothetical protein